MTTQTPCMRQPDLWFSSDPDDQYEAAAACGFCPLRAECRPVGDGEIYGVWGGVLRGRTHNTVVQPFRRDCGWCGNEFTARTSVAVYCSTVCKKQGKLRAEQNRTRKPKPTVVQTETKCDHHPCGKSFVPTRRGQMFCTPLCSKQARRARERLAELVQAAS